MRINKIVLDGYKRFRHLTIDLWANPARIIALIWPNWCGKSSVFDWILYKANSFAQIWDKWRKDWRYHSLDWDPAYSSDKVNIYFEHEEYDDVFHQKQAIWLHSTIFSFRNSYRYNSSVNVKETKALKELNTNYYWATQSTDLDDKMVENYQRLLVKYNTYMHINDCKPSEAHGAIIEELNCDLYQVV